MMITWTPIPNGAETQPRLGVKIRWAGGADGGVWSIEITRTGVVGAAFVETGAAAKAAAEAAAAEWAA